MSTLVKTRNEELESYYPGMGWVKVADAIETKPTCDRVQIASPLLGKPNSKTGVTPADMEAARYEEALEIAAPMVLP